MTDNDHIVFISDGHLGLRFPYTTTGSQSRYLKMQLDALQSLLDLKGTKVIMGDLFHSFMPSALTLCQAFQLLAGRRDVIVMAGNHDKSKTRTDSSGLVLLQQMLAEVGVGDVGEETVFVVNEPSIQYVNNTALYLIPHQLTQEMFDAAIAKASTFKDDSVKKILVLHCNQGDFPGTQAENYLSTEQLKTLSNFDKIISGHEHSAKTVANMVYPGSVVPCNFAEFGNRYLYTFDSVLWEEHVIPYNTIPGFPDFSFDRVPYEDFINPDLRGVHSKFTEVYGVVSPADSVKLTKRIVELLNSDFKIAIKPAVTIQANELAGQAPADLADVETWWDVVTSRLSQEGNTYLNTFAE